VPDDDEISPTYRKLILDKADEFLQTGGDTHIYNLEVEDFIVPDPGEEHCFDVRVQGWLSVKVRPPTALDRLAEET
jgi:hypothetical protein